ncbi:hypothetical protein B0H14DRAFT_2567791 [Mycena olivaceomarginata]|nr:hypothetical protein B0H14DRAFT_2567791 [Mycena olivaceomarginata]
MLDLLSVTLILCLLASNFNRIVAIVLWVSDYLARPRGPRLVPYFDEQGMSRFLFCSFIHPGDLIGMVRVGPDFRPPASRPRSPSLSVVASESEDLSDNDIASSTRPRAQSSGLHIPIQQVLFFWDFWPDGEFQCVVSAQDLQDSGNLATNWVLETTRDRGTTRARSWHQGHELRWRCLGTIECHGKTCPIELAPASRAVDRHKQLGQLCICGETLRLRLCGVESSLFRFRDGAVFIHRGFHTHSAFTHSSMPSVAKISPLLVNADRVKYERQKVLRGSGGHGGDHFLSEFAKIEASNPNFIRSSQFGVSLSPPGIGCGVTPDVKSFFSPLIMAPPESNPWSVVRAYHTKRNKR